MDLKPVLNKFLKEEELELIMNDALCVLEKIGIGCTLEKGIRILAGFNGITYSNGRLLFSQNEMREHIQKRREEWKTAINQDEPPFSMGGCWCGLNYCDPMTQKIRPATTDESIRMTRMWDARDVNGVIPVLPGDVNLRMQTVIAEKICLLNSKKLGGWLAVIDSDEARFIAEMYQVMDRRFEMFQQVFISPLRINDESFSCALEFLEDDCLDVVLGGSIPMFGVTTPHNLHAALVQSFAERLAYDMVVCLLLPKKNTGKTAKYSMLRLEPFDMQYGVIVFGSPEWCLLTAAIRQVQEYWTGVKHYGGSFRSTSKHPDAQAAMERTASVQWQAMLGARNFSAVGQLSVDEVFSPQQAIIDGEILKYVERLNRGVKYERNENATMELIQEGLVTSSYISTEETNRQFREFYYFPEIFKHWNVGNWANSGSPSILDVAWGKAQELIKKSDFRPPQEKIREVEKIYKKAEHSLMVIAKCSGS